MPGIILVQKRFSCNGEVSMAGLLVDSISEEPEFVIPAEAGIQDLEPKKHVFLYPSRHKSLEK